MSFFQDLSCNARTCAGKVSRKADAAVEISRLKINETRLQREISKSLKLLGAKVYKAYSVKDSDLDVGSDVTYIRDMYERLKTIRSQISELKSAEFGASEEKDEENREV